MDAQGYWTVTTAAAIRDAIYDRLQSGYVLSRKTPFPQLQPENLPALSVFVLQGRFVPDGEANVAEPRFTKEDTIAISIARGFEDPVVLEGAIDAEVDLILTNLLCDPTFVRFSGGLPRNSAEAWVVGQRVYFDDDSQRATIVATGNFLMGFAAGNVLAGSVTADVVPLFEAVTGIVRRWVFPKDGETYFAELRLEITFESRSAFPPVVEDDLESIRVTTAFPLGGDQSSVQQVSAAIDLSTD